MKKTYTKKQIQEAIAYWKKQLTEGNYRKTDKLLEDENYSVKEIRSFDDLASEYADCHDFVVFKFGKPKRDGSFKIDTDEGPFDVTMDELRDEFGVTAYLGDGNY